MIKIDGDNIDIDDDDDDDDEVNVGTPGFFCDRRQSS